MFSKKCSNKKKNKPPCILTFFFRNWLLFDRNLIIGIIKINWTDLIKNFGFLKKHTYTVIHLVCWKEKKKRGGENTKKNIFLKSLFFLCVYEASGNTMANIPALQQWGHVTPRHSKELTSRVSSWNREVSFSFTFLNQDPSLGKPLADSVHFQIPSFKTGCFLSF